MSVAYGMRLARLLLALVVVVVTVVAFGASAYATPNAGPWDVTATFWKDTSTTLSSRIRVSVDSDDEVSGRYKLCVTIHQAGFADEYSAVSLNTTSGTLDTSSSNGLVSREQVPQRSVNNVAVTVDNAKVLAAATTCDGSATGLPIRGRGNVTTVPAGQLGSTDSTPDEPLASGVPGTDAPAPVVDCARVLSQNGGSNVATFAAEVEPVAGTEDSYEWDFGDASAAATALDVQHIYGAVSSQPEGGWTATLTVTRVGDGVTYSEDEVTGTCALRIDFLNPSQSDPVGGGDLETGDDSDCPSGWGWLNPAAIGSILKCLFIPESLGEPVGDFIDAWSSSPLGLVTTPAVVLFDSMATFEDGTNEAAAPCEGPALDVPLPLGGGEESVPLEPLSTCPDGALGSFLGPLDLIMRAAIVLGAGFTIVRLLGSLLGTPTVARTYEGEQLELFTIRGGA